MSCWNYKARGSKSTIAGVTRLPGFEWKPLRLTTGSSHSRHAQIRTHFPFFLCSSRSDRPGRLARPPSGHWVQPLQGSFQRLPEDGKSAAIGRSRHTSAHYGSCRPRLYPWRSVCLFRPTRHGRSAAVHVNSLPATLMEFLAWRNYLCTAYGRCHPAHCSF